MKLTLALPLALSALHTVQAAGTTLVLGIFADNQCKNPAILAYSHTSTSNPSTAAAAALPDTCVQNPSAKGWIRMTSTSDRVTLATYPNLNNAAKAVVGAWKSADCQGDPEVVQVVYALPPGVAGEGKCSPQEGLSFVDGNTKLPQALKPGCQEVNGMWVSYRCVGEGGVIASTQTNGAGKLVSSSVTFASMIFMGGILMLF